MIYFAEEVISLRKLQIDLLELLYPDKDYQYAAQYEEIACRHLVTIFLQNNDRENTWHWLHKGADFTIHMDTYDFDSAHTSLLLRNHSDGGWIMEASGNRSQSLLEWLTADKKAQTLRSDPRFEVLVNHLKKVAKKP